MSAGVPQKIEAYGCEWSFAAIARVAGVSREAVRQSWNRGVRGEALFRGALPDSASVWHLGLSVRQWQRIVRYAERESAIQAADVYDVPLGAVEDAMAGRWELLD